MAGAELVTSESVDASDSPRTVLASPANGKPPVSVDSWCLRDGRPLNRSCLSGVSFGSDKVHRLVRSYPVPRPAFPSTPGRLITYMS